MHPHCRDIWRVNDESYLDSSCQNDGCVYVKLVIPVLFCFLGPNQHPSIIRFDNAHVTVGTFDEISAEAEKHAKMVWRNNLDNIKMAVSLNYRKHPAHLRPGRECFDFLPIPQTDVTSVETVLLELQDHFLTEQRTANSWIPPHLHVSIQGGVKYWGYARRRRRSDTGSSSDTSTVL